MTHDAHSQSSLALTRELSHHAYREGKEETFFVIRLTSPKSETIVQAPKDTELN